MTETAASQRPDVQNMSFEEALAELRTIVSRLEQGEGKLDEAIDAYERGAALKAHCEEKLRDAQAKIEKITLKTSADGQQDVGVTPFDSE
ncbi:exodeoxyribonuclease VII small subunit [Kiloniella sp. b19]|uniref:exodeoxyribonuclease VII small subunit n=1 Tax=Kiloniella sp. GXU_MW_B19 TaxID=3141326 RepID=UPI0031D6B838